MVLNLILLQWPKELQARYLPLSATAVKKEIYDVLKDNGEYDYFRHVNTFGGNPAACALALKNIEMMEKEQLFSRSKQEGAYLKQSLTAALSQHKFVGDIRGKGLLIGIELVKDKATKEPLEV